ncbi:MAG: hypothetical protein ACR2II_08180 [Chthoniobacterales bacterium]
MKCLGVAINQYEALRADPAGGDVPEINGQLAGHGDDGFLARRPGGESAFA